MKSKKTILLIEDDQIDAITVKRAFKKCHITNRLVFAGDGEEAMEYLRDPEKENPGFILLDLNLPKMNGIELLKTVKQDDSLKRIPVVVLTTSHEEQDRKKCFDLGVSGYILKPVGFNNLIEAIKTIDEYWTLSELPEGA